VSAQPKTPWQAPLERWSASRDEKAGGPGLFIGIGGGSASGKTTIADEIARRLGGLGGLTVEVINQDRFFKPKDELPTYYSKIYDEPRPAYNRPDCYRAAEMFTACGEARGSDPARPARRGEPAAGGEHDGAAPGAILKGGSDVVIFEGILALYFDELRELMDVSLYVEADADERIIRRTRRNMVNWSFDEITNYYLESVRWDHAEFNAPTRRHADVVIPGGMAEEDTRERERLLSGLCDEVIALWGG